MPINSCWGEQNRLRILSEFDIRPIHHMHAPGDTKIQSCSGRGVETYFYVLEYRNKRNPEGHGTSFAGRHCAEAMLRLLGLPRLKPEVLFPDQPQPPQPSAGASTEAAATRERPVPLTPLNQEISEVLNLMVWDGLPNPPRATGPITRLLTSLRQSPDRDLAFPDVKALNTTVAGWVRQDPRGIRTVGDKLERKYGKPVHVRQFPEIHKVLVRRNTLDRINPAQTYSS